MRKWRSNPINRKRQAESIRAWKARNKKKLDVYRKKWKEENQEKLRAHALVRKAIQVGLLVRAFKCERCKKDGKTEAHHSDYSKPLEVKWLCPSCHSAIHNWAGK